VGHIPLVLPHPTIDNEFVVIAHGDQLVPGADPRYSTQRRFTIGRRAMVRLKQSPSPSFNSGAHRSMLVRLTIARTRVVYRVSAVPLAIDAVQTVRPTGIVIFLCGVHLINHNPRLVKDQLLLYQAIWSDEQALPTARRTSVVYREEHVVGCGSCLCGRWHDFGVDGPSFRRAL
jgi:hypothetical protein